ncbi:unnamed protein product [Phyllotreta striolata]|uniref:Uncharacterized protein n=1 Tax=Phyllotreta striolata TaxID=444603 RepID=A0A9N9TN58_PHYSR|nr:unnamed protein product [Phyllotreta striolata]
MTSEEFYDSLDENSDNEICNNSKKQFSSTHKIDDGRNKVEPVPFYKGHLTLSRLDLNQAQSQRNELMKKLSKTKSKLKLTVASLPRPKKSYLDMFYDKTGVNKYDDDGCIECDSSRPTCSSSSPKSFRTCDGDLECDNVYDLDLKSNSEVSSDFMKSKSPKCVPNLNLRSDSPKNGGKFSSKSEKRLDTGTTNHVNSKSMLPLPKSIKPVELKKEKSDANVSKMDLWKKRQLYGRKVSQTNRIQMMEKEALQLLVDDKKVKMKPKNTAKSSNSHTSVNGAGCSSKVSIHKP